MSRRVVVLAVAGIAALVLVVYLAVAVRSGSTAASDSTVGGVSIGGMTPEEAQAAVEEGLAPLAGKRLRVTALDQTDRKSVV